ncbi:uncharacterized protein F5891DRAFT_986591 [Suillus fuscotomentosus]|uniref:Uncharacterized protein n=1 Tax=Suillus fuscotomentosus TaxID=1912939 RepID=A0AAD4HDX6_9AGAM|nr:uncharacterized protein F5891DRAFT_986591 [Suillus fuscotomentosus]KAG1891716.1 hypothetical protein F5891DRAFT_986591 [Suillus fuscotomentosus]
MPVGNDGNFSDRGQRTYSVVLEMQHILVEGLLDLRLFKGSNGSILRVGICAAFFPYGIGHSLGMDVRVSRVGVQVNHQTAIIVRLTAELGNGDLLPWSRHYIYTALLSPTINVRLTKFSSY